MRTSSLQRRRRQTGTRAEAPKKGHVEWNRWELLALGSSFLLLLYMWLCYENFHFHVTHFYAHLGYPSAQHLVGQRYLRGVGVGRDEEMASHWFSRAAQNKLVVGGPRNQNLTV